MNVINSHKDRHANIGFGTIGFDNLLSVIYNKRLSDIPMILETPMLLRTIILKRRYILLINMKLK